MKMIRIILFNWIVMGRFIVFLRMKFFRFFILVDWFLVLFMKMISISFR